MLVANVTPGGAAEAAGIQRTHARSSGYVLGDLITAIDGKPVHDVKSVAQIVSQKKVGDVLTLSVVRDGQTRKVPVTLRPQPAETDD